MADMSVKVGNLTLKNPIIAGSGPITGTAENIRKCVDAGFGAICTKNISYFTPLQRYPRPLYYLADYRRNPDEPYYVPDDYTWLFTDHNSVFPPEKFVEIIASISGYCHEKDCVLIANFSGRGLEEWERMAGMLVDSGARALELNFACPFPADMRPLGMKEEDAHIGLYFTLNPVFGCRVIERVKKSVDVPVIAKFSAEGSQFDKMAKDFESAGADGVSMFGNARALRIDIENGMPINHGICAGTSPALKMHSLAWVASIAKVTGVSVIGGRGASTWKDAVEFLMAGAEAVQYCTPIMIRGADYAGSLLAGIENFMHRHGYAKIADFQGMALKHLKTTKDVMEKEKPLYAEVDYGKCTGCYRCLDVCWFSAIRALPKKVQVLTERCVGCTLCSQVCPHNAFRLGVRDDEIDYLRALAMSHRELAPEDLLFSG